MILWRVVIYTDIKLIHLWVQYISVIVSPFDKKVLVLISAMHLLPVLEETSLEKMGQ